MWSAAIALAVGTLLGLARGAHAAHVDAPLQVDADEVEYQAERELYVARGHVVLTQRGRTLHADRVYFSNRTRQGVASGDVVLNEANGDTMRAPFVQFNIDSTQGLILQGELDSPVGNYRMHGDEIRKTGEETYEFKNGYFTTCRCPNKDDRDPWAVTAERATVDLEGYGRAYNGTAEILGVPLLWIPYAVYPLKRERQTGFMFPEGGTSSRTGGDVTLPFFWAVADNVDATLEAQYQVRRGFKESALVEYLNGLTGKGQIYGTYIDDQDIKNNQGTSAFGPSRWGARWEHTNDLPYRSHMAVDAVAVSDNQFPFDFTDFRKYRRDRFLRSTGWADTHLNDDTGRYAVMVSGQSSDDLQNPDDQDRDQFLLQRLPQVDVTALPDKAPGIPGLVVDSGVQLVNFQPYGDASSHFGSRLRVRNQFYDTGIDGIADGNERNSSGNRTLTDTHHDDAKFVPDGPEGDGKFEEGEPLADHGQRLVAHPRVAYPFQLGDVIQIYPEAGYYGTFYDAARAGFDQRSLFTGRLDISTRFRGDVHMPGLGDLSHTAEPFIGWVGISNTGQNGNPLFVPTTAVPQDRLRLLERDNLTLDPSDRINDANNIVFGVNNRLASIGGGLQSEITLITQYEVAQHKWGDAVLQGRTNLPAGFFVRFHGVLDLASEEFADGLADVGWSAPGGHRLSIGYRYVKDIPRVFENFVRTDRFQDFLSGFNRINQISGAARWQATKSWALTYTGNYSFDNAVSLINQFGIEYLSKCNCWAVKFEVNQDRTRGVDWTVQYRVVGLGEPPERLFTH